MSSVIPSPGHQPTRPAGGDTQTGGAGVVVCVAVAVAVAVTVGVAGSGVGVFEGTGVLDGVGVGASAQLTCAGLEAGSVVPLTWLQYSTRMRPWPPKPPHSW